MRLGLIGFLFLGVLACGKNKEDSSNVSSKALFTVWTDHTTGKVLDLQGGHLGTSSMYFVFASGGKCVCTLDMVGTTSSGAYVLSSCTYTTGGSGDPGCSSVNQNGTYDNNSTTLTICASSLCSYYN